MFKYTFKQLATLLLVLVVGAGMWVPVSGQSTIERGRQRVTRMLVGDGTAAAPSYSFASETNSGWFRVGTQNVALSIAGTPVFGAKANGAQIGSSQYLGWTNGDASGTVDTILFRDAANTLAQRNGTNAQAFRVYNTYATAGVDYERAAFGWSANTLVIGTQAGGTGQGRGIQFQIGNAGAWSMDGSGHLIADTDNTKDIGAAGATRPRNVYVANITNSTYFKADSAGSYSFSGSTTLKAPSDGVATISNNAGTDFSRLQFGGTTSSFPAVARNGAALDYTRGDGTIAATLNGTLTTSTTSTCTTAVTTEEDLWTYSLPAGALSADGRGVRITAWVAFGGNANNKTVKMYFGSSTQTYGPSAINGGGLMLEGEVLRSGAATQVGWFRNTSTTPATAFTITSPTETLSGAVTIKVTGQNGTASAGDVCVKGAIVETIK